MFDFAPAAALNGVGASAMQAVDLDGDGTVDLASADLVTSHVSILWGTGELTSHPVGETPEVLLAADLDGDGDTDLVTGNGGDASSSLLLNAGGRAFDSEVLDHGLDAEAIGVLDLDGVPPVDLAIVEGGDDESGVLHLVLRAADAFTLRTWPAAGINPRVVLPMDLDHDCAPDLVVVHKQSDEIALFATDHLR